MSIWCPKREIRLMEAVCAHNLAVGVCRIGKKGCQMVKGRSTHQKEVKPVKSTKRRVKL